MHHTSHLATKTTTAMTALVTNIFGSSVKACDLAKTFGHSWRECLFPVSFFCVERNSLGLVRIENATSGDPTARFGGSNCFIFAPVEGELVTGVDFCHSFGVITAIRFITSEQTTPWFGEHTGGSYSYRSQDSYYIHSFAGIGSCGYSLRRLDVVLWPRAVPQAVVSAGHYEISNRDLHGANVTPDVAAFVIELASGDKAVVAITALSARQCEWFEKLREHLQFPKTDLLVRFLKNEKVIGVQYMKQATSVTAVRFQTNRRTMPWIGADVADAVQHAVDLGELQKDAYICGFLAEGTGEMKSVNAVYWVPKTP